MIFFKLFCDFKVPWVLSPFPTFLTAPLLLLSAITFPSEVPAWNNFLYCAIARAAGMARIEEGKVGLLRRRRSKRGNAWTWAKLLHSAYVHCV